MTRESRNKIYTVGHSTHPIDQFLAILKKNRIDAVVDVRSVPYSRFADQYNKDRLSAVLAQHRIHYIAMGDLLGARHDDPSLRFDGGKVDFEKVSRTRKFRAGIDRLDDGIGKGYTIALMCSEKNPLECHRFALISRFLDKQGYLVIHLLPNKQVPHRVLDDRLYEYFKIKKKITYDMDRVLRIRGVQEELFNRTSKRDMYVVLNKMIAYTPSQ